MNYHQTLKTDSNMKTIIAVPLFHVTGLIGQLLHMVYAGGTSIILNNYQNEKYIEEIQKHKVDFLFNVPSIFMMMRTSPLFDKYTFDFVKKVAYGGSPIYKETLEMLREAFPNASFHNAYGATETSSPATIMPLEYPLSKASSVGLPVTGAEILIIDQLNNECKPGEEGEVLIKGPMVIEKYWQNQKANDTSLKTGIGNLEISA
nr:AMP-binding protein [Thalassobacillus sp. C254]